MIPCALCVKGYAVGSEMKSLSAKLICHQFDRNPPRFCHRILDSGTAGIGNNQQAIGLPYEPNLTRILLKIR